MNDWTMRWRLLGSLAALGLTLPLAACGSEQSKMERGIVVDQEEAVPDSARDDAMTEAQRRAKEVAEEEKKERIE